MEKIKNKIKNFFSNSLKNISNASFMEKTIFLQIKWQQFFLKQFYKNNYINKKVIFNVLKQSSCFWIQNIIFLEIIDILPKISIASYKDNFKIIFYLKSKSSFFLGWNYEFFSEINFFLNRLFLKKSRKKRSLFPGLDFFLKILISYLKCLPLFDVKILKDYLDFSNRVIFLKLFQKKFVDVKNFGLSYNSIFFKTISIFCYGKYICKKMKESLTDKNKTNHGGKVLRAFFFFLKLKGLETFSTNSNVVYKEAIWKLKIKNKIFDIKKTLIRKKKIKLK